MFIVDLFEQQPKQLKKLVIMPGGFHPWHPGHSSLYVSAKQAFPDADIFVVSTNDTSARPFPFEVKRQLAVMAGVPASQFVQVKSPFQAKEVVSQYDPETTALIFVRSQKDQQEQPVPGGTKKNGEPGYLQPYESATDLQPMSRHGYIAYLPVVNFKAGQSGISSATEIRNAWPSADDATKQTIVQDLYPKIAQNTSIITKVIKLLDRALSTTNEDAAGVGAIANKSQIHDPRYSMSITQDVGPDTLKKNLAAFSLSGISNKKSRNKK